MNPPKNSKTADGQPKMKQLFNDVNQLVIQEYQRAALKFGEKNNGPHESYAVIREEYQEARDEIRKAKHELKSMWDAVKHDQPTEEQLIRLELSAIHAAAKCIQLAAMAHKALLGYEKEHGE